MVMPSLDWRQETLLEPRPTILLCVDATGGTLSTVSAEALATALRSDNHDVLVASKTAEVIERFNDMWIEAKYGASLELIILHLTRPAWANLAMLEYVRKVDWALPVIVVAATDDEEEIQQAKRLGATIVFRCQFDVDDLRTAVVNTIPAP